MFTSTRPNLYESSDGFSVEVLGPTGLCYREGDRKMFVDSEVVAGPSGLAIYRGSIERWDAPHEAHIVSAVERERIANNIREAFRFFGFEIHVIG
jgi:hypothetical protein